MEGAWREILWNNGTDESRSAEIAVWVSQFLLEKSYIFLKLDKRQGLQSNVTEKIVKKLGESLEVTQRLRLHPEKIALMKVSMII